MSKKLEKQLSFLETTHTYFYGRKEVIGVTRILELAGMSDYSKVPYELLERAQTFGRHLHKGCELIDRGIPNGKILEVDPGLAPYIQGWKAFIEYEVESFLSIEEIIFSPSLWYAGTLDRVAKMKRGGNGLIEIKSSDALHPAGALQTAGYQKPWERKHKMKIDRRYAVQPMNNGDYVVTEYKNYSDDYADFLACLRVANRKLRDKIK